jgi:hypothetical protein
MPNRASLNLPLSTQAMIAASVSAVAASAPTRTASSASPMLFDAERRDAGEHEAETAEGEAHHLNRDTALVSPVDVLKVEDERELVEHERRSDADSRGRDDRGRGVRPGVESEVGAGDEEDDSGHGVVDVRTAV